METLDKAIRKAEKMYLAKINSGMIHGPKSADEMAAEVAGDVAADFGFGFDSYELEAILSAVSIIASDKYPGDW